MWFFMYSCYILSFLTLIGLVTGFFQSFLKFNVLAANHLTFMIFVSIIYAFAETLVIFFFVGTGVSIRDYTKDHNLDATYHQKSIAIKRKVYPPLLLNMLFMIILFCLVGAVDTHRVPSWIYYILFLFCIFDYCRIKIIQNQCFKLNTENILQMSGIK